ncbi:MAG: hypothetical protein ACM359_06340 [Bacillota bacterium]
MKRFAYSYDREDYTGSFSTPEDAVAAAVANAEGISSPPTEIFVGELTQADPQATDHAEQIVEAMNRRAHVDYGDAASRYLRNVTKEQVKDLDQSIAQAILGWLQRNELMPTFTKVRNIREYPVPYPGQTSLRPASQPTEVNEIGISDEVSY